MEKGKIEIKTWAFKFDVERLIKSHDKAARGNQTRDPHV